MGSVLFFAELQEKVGKNKLSFHVEGLTVKELKQTIQEDYDLEQVNQAMIAVNEEFAGDETVLEKEDVVAFIPPVSGG